MSHYVKRRAASDRKDKQVWGVEIMSSFSGILGGRQVLPGQADLSGRWLDTGVWAQAQWEPGRT